MKLPVRMEEAEVSGLPKEPMERAIAALGKYLAEDFWPKDAGFSRHALMGPAGKMLEVLQGGRLTNREAILGYLTQVHNQSSRLQLGEAGLARLGEAVDALLAIRSAVSERQWMRALREVGYGVYAVQYAVVQERTRLRREPPPAAAEGGREAE